MYRVDNATAVTALPVPPPAGTQGFFTDGSLSPPQRPTIVDAWWANTVQEELITVIAASGLQLNKNSNTQLYEALTRMFMPIGGGEGPDLTGFLPLTGGTLYRAGVQGDILHIEADSGLNARTVFTNRGIRSWAAGCGGDGRFVIRDITRAANPFTIDFNGILILHHGDLILDRRDQPMGYILRPDIPGYKNLTFAIVGGGFLENCTISALTTNIGWDMIVGNNLTANANLVVAGGTTVTGLTASGVTTAFLQVNETSSFNGEAVFNTNARVLGPFTAGEINCLTTCYVAGNISTAGNVGSATMEVSGRINTNQLGAQLIECQGEINGGGHINGNGLNATLNIVAGGNITATGVLHSTGGTEVISNHAYKYTGGAWLGLFPAERRTTRDIASYTRGLDAVRQLRPCTYRCNDLPDLPAPDAVFEGLIADDVLPVAPELVMTRRAKLNADDRDETDLLSLRLDPLTYMLINAVQELAARVEALEAREATALPH